MLVYSATMAGSHHAERDEPSQDACFYKETADGFTIAAVADGLGSEAFSGTASEIASREAVEYCAEKISKGMDDEEILMIIKDSFRRALDLVEQRAKDDGNPFDQYDTTLCLAVYDGDTLYFGQSGDSGIIGLTSEGNYIKVTKQQRDEYGYVYPLAFGEEYWTFDKVENISAFMLVTDGVWEQLAPPIISGMKKNVNERLAAKFLDHFDENCNVDELQQNVYNYLLNHQYIHDDKTVVGVINPERKPKQKPLKPIDFNSVRKKLLSELYNTKEEPDDESFFDDSGAVAVRSVEEKAQINSKKKKKT